MIIVIVVLVVAGIVGGLLIVRTRPAARLSSGRTKPAGASRVASASAALAADDAAAERFRLIASQLFALPAPSAVPGNASEQQQDIADALAHLDNAAERVERAGKSLMALATADPGTADGDDGTQAKALAAALADIAKLPVEEAGPDNLVKAIASRARHAAADTPTTGDESGSSRLAAKVRALPVDPHATARAELLAGMAALGLDGTWTDLGTWPEFARLRDGYDERQLDLARDFTRSMYAARDRAAATIALGEPGGQDLHPQEAEVRRMARELCAASVAYADQARVLLGSRADRARWLAAVPDLVARCEEQLRGGNLAAVMAELAAAPAPVIPSWPPSREYSAAWQRLADGFEVYTDLHRRQEPVPAARQAR
jgi:hypothetical protein